jgi:hypothetical protein
LSGALPMTAPGVGIRVHLEPGRAAPVGNVPIVREEEDHA